MPTVRTVQTSYCAMQTFEMSLVCGYLVFRFPPSSQVVVLAIFGGLTCTRIVAGPLGPPKGGPFRRGQLSSGVANVLLLLLVMLKATHRRRMVMMSAAVAAGGGGLVSHHQIDEPVVVED